MSYLLISFVVKGLVGFQVFVFIGKRDFCTIDTEIIVTKPLLKDK